MAGETGAEVTEAWCCSLAACGNVVFEAVGGSMRDVMDGEALARLSGGEMGDGAVAGAEGLVSMMPPRMGS
jgi:hypothetical protein